MYNFEYVDEKDYKSEKEELTKIIKRVQDKVREDFTFDYVFVGSSTRNLITCDFSQNIGFDFDVDINVNDDDEKFTAKEIKLKLMLAFNGVNENTKYGNCEDSTRVFTIKVVDIGSNSILHACDFAIIKDCDNGQRQYIHHNKRNKSYSWEYKSQKYYELTKKEQWLKKNNLWDTVRLEYIINKNKNQDKNKHSSAIFVETINNIASKYGYNE